MEQSVHGLVIPTWYACRAITFADRECSGLGPVLACMEEPAWVPCGTAQRRRALLEYEALVWHAGRHAPHRWTIAPQCIEQFKFALSIFKV